VTTVAGSFEPADFVRTQTAMRHLPRSTRSSRVASRRTGSLLPALAVAIVTALGCAALVIDRLALDSARSELRTAAEAAALAAARELASDDRLRQDYKPAALRMKARFAAATIAQENVVAGEPLQLSIASNGDIRFGILDTDASTSEPVFIETSDDEEATTVVVKASRTRVRGTALPLPFQSLNGPSEGELAALAEASVNFHVNGLRTVDDLPIPTLPLAILTEAAASTKSEQQRAAANDAAQRPSWSRDIRDRRGFDRYGLDVESGTIVDEPDGIPEITLRTATLSANPRTNAYILALTGELTQDDLRRQIQRGWTADDLRMLGGEILLDRGALTMAGLRGVESHLLVEAFRKVVGQSRVVFLYESADASSGSAASQLTVTSFVAGRVMSVRAISESECELVFQPAVLATRSAVVGETHDGEPNPYVANLRLTN
jgi:hypothetical protein